MDVAIVFQTNMLDFRTSTGKDQLTEMGTQDKGIHRGSLSSNKVRYMGKLSRLLSGNVYLCRYDVMSIYNVTHN